MKIIKKINTSAAIALDSLGREIVVFGKGIGFPKVPYELDDLTKIERTFYDINPKNQDIIANIPKEIIDVSADILDIAEMELNVVLNPNFVFTLADHLNFARERLMNGIELTSPIAYDIKHMYRKEYEVAKKSLDLLFDRTGILLPESEAINIVLHIINGEKGSTDFSAVVSNARMINEVDRIIEHTLNIELNKESYEYSRYVKHLMYLIQKFKSNNATENKNSRMLKVLSKEYPDAYLCAVRITDYFEKTWKWNCNDDEILYLLLHISRLIG